MDGHNGAVERRPPAPYLGRRTRSSAAEAAGELGSTPSAAASRWARRCASHARARAPGREPRSRTRAADARSCSGELPEPGCGRAGASRALPEPRDPRNRLTGPPERLARARRPHGAADRHRFEAAAPAARPRQRREQGLRRAWRRGRPWAHPRVGPNAGNVTDPPGGGA